MKAVIVSTAYPMRGGIAQYTSILYKYLSFNHNVKVYSFKRQYPEFLFPGKTQYETSEPAYRIPDADNKAAVDSINPFNWFFTALKIRKEKPDLLIYKYWIPFFAPCFFTIAFFVKMFTKTKVLYICDNVIPHEKRFGDIFLTKLAFSVADYFIVQSKTVEKDLKLLNKRNKPYVFTPHPLYNIFGEKVDGQQAREFIRKEYGKDLKNENVILFFGYVRRYKGLHYLLDAMPGILKSGNVKLLVAGEFYDDEKPYREKIENLKLRDDVLLVSDFLPDDRIKYFFSAADAVVLPYLSATQSGIVQICYFYDKPVIATDVGGIGEVVISGKTGILVEPENTGQLSDAVNEFFSKNLGTEFSANIEKEKIKYTWEEYVKQLENLTLKERN